ncbi:MAG: bifunctional riboflavin kinase/FAD synthetase [Bacteroidaceae bacterium]|nr:bifunctional riboflavin kinase/FAD synthetase [Bacteroidaceae bacterium]
MEDNRHSQLHGLSSPSGRGEGRVCTIGFFDGVHRGHLCLIRQVQEEARRRGERSLLVTFDRHPRSVFAPEDAPQLLTSPEEKVQLLREAGVDDIFVLPFDRQMAALTAREFMEKVLLQQLKVSTLVIGYDHHFGRPQGETFEDYKTYGQEVGIDVVLAQELQGEHISSSAIRRALEAGDVATATHLMGRPYCWTGRVVHGRAIGRQLGFPTANLEALEPQKMLPARGAYAILITTANRQQQKAMLNIGCRPTLDNGTDTSVEAHLLDFCEDLYGQELTLTFIARLRAERRFDDEQELIRQLESDSQQTLRILQETTNPTI